ncbi:hypothetical protein PspLS_10060 [Pyricularia sp. CBS 133598]|nr:hypothetical protein PspLS_10060 [Pyricularia sp. CBS 133598]
MKFSTIISTFALASVGTATATNPNMNQEGSPIAARSPGPPPNLPSSSRPPLAPVNIEWPRIETVSNNPAEQGFRRCLATLPEEVAKEAAHEAAKEKLAAKFANMGIGNQ